MDKITVRLTEKSLAKVGVDLIDKYGVWLQCKNSGQYWSPNLLSGGRLPKGWWKCPTNHCNENGE